MLSRLKNDSGIILMLVLWILVILTIIVVGIGRRTSMELNQAKYTIGKIKAKYIAVAGLIFAVDKILEDSKAQPPGDTKYTCGFQLKEEQTPEDVFKEAKAGEGHFDVRYDLAGTGQNRDIRYGLQDEESKININGLNNETYRVLKELLMIFGQDEDTAEGIAASVVDWRDENRDVLNQRGAEEDYYAGLPIPYPCKNQPFDSVEELLLVKGMTPEIFAQIRPFLTVFPKTGRFQVNVDTASRPVLQAMARSFSGSRTNTSIEDADSLTEKIVAHRQGEDDADATADDAVAQMPDMGLNAKEMVIFLMMSNYRTKVSDYLRVMVRGVEENSRAVTTIDAVVFRQDLSIVYWHRN